MGCTRPGSLWRAVLGRRVCGEPAGATNSGVAACYGMLWAGFLSDLPGVLLCLLTVRICLFDCPKVGPITSVLPCSMYLPWPGCRKRGCTHRDEHLDSGPTGVGHHGVPSWRPAARTHSHGTLAGSPFCSLRPSNPLDQYSGADYGLGGRVMRILPGWMTTKQAWSCSPCCWTRRTTSLAIWCRADEGNRR